MLKNALNESKGEYNVKVKLHDQDQGILDAV